jgi:DNA-binding NtrC family response regulator
MDLAMQVKLLRVLQEMEMTRVGGNKKIQLEFRLIVATHRNLLQEVKAGRFREDLYYRLMGITIELPPLRNRGKDIVILANYFLKQFCKKNKLPEKSFSNSAIKTLLSYSFPGNVRELKAVVESAIVLSDESVIEQEDLSLVYEDNPEQLLNSEMSLEDYTNQIIQLSLKRNNHNVVKTAEKLGIGKSTIYRLIKEGKITTL